MSQKSSVIEDLPNASKLASEAIDGVTGFAKCFHKHKSEEITDLKRARDELVEETDPYAMKLGTGLPTAKFVVDFIDGNLSKAANELDANKSDIVRAVN